MKILHTCLSCFYIDNYAYQENLLPKYHVKLGYDVTVLASLVSYNEDGKYCLLDKESVYNDINGYKIIRMNYKKCIIPKLTHLLRIYTNTYQILEQESPDIIFIHSGSFWDVKKIIKYKNKYPNVKLFVDSHTDYVNSGTNWLSKYILHRVIWRYVYRLLVPHVEQFWGVTPLRCEYLIKEYHVPQVIVKYLPMGVDDDIIPQNRLEISCGIRQKLNIKQDDFVIVTGGKIDERKNIHHLLNALEQINNKRVHVIVFGVIVPEMQNYFKRYENNINFHFVGWSSDDIIIKYLVSSDLACYPGTHSTLWEESIGVGVPCIFKKWKGMEHVNVNGNCKFVKGDDECELKKYISSLIFSNEYNVLKKNSEIASLFFRYSNIAKQSILI